MRTSSRRRMSGLSLVELLVAVALGLFLSLALVAVFVMSNRAYSDAERESRMGDNGRFAMQLLTRELRHAGFVGGPPLSSVEADGDLGAVASDCTGDASALAFLVPSGGTSAPAWRSATASGAGAVYGCITDAVPGSTAIAIKSVRPVPAGAPGAGTNGYHILSNRLRGILFHASDGSPPGLAEVPNGQYWEYQWHVYYVRNLSTPTLSRKTLLRSGGQNTVATEDLVAGIDDLNLVQPDPNNPLSVQVFLLVRGLTRETGNVVAGTNRSFDMGRAAASTSTDAFRRVVLRSSIALRNS